MIVHVAEMLQHFLGNRVLCFQHIQGENHEKDYSNPRIRSRCLDSDGR